ncbi:hypothetical protein Ocin01_04959 [Orchesella cincta]|uniref:Uncharacterized protein n=1 Tax=Orchesella cincta TaxID=48709 RepID=A0A1D2N905_ORCCI|nr:hypothetical protein Ocin01_04959 [Orchesella cincta]
MKCSVVYFGSLVICTFIACGLFQGGDAGKTLKLPGYRLKFGTWPLVEVSKTGSRFKHGRRAKNNGPPRNHQRPPNGYKLGPPPPGKLVLVNPGEHKGSLHQQLQASLKHYAKQPANQNLPIIVKSPGPNPPPPPPGYKLGPPQNSLNSNPLQFTDASSPSGSNYGPPPLKFTDGKPWTPGPPPTQGSSFNSQGGRPSKLYSALKHSSFSEIFNNGYTEYRSPEVLEGRPLPGPYISINPDGSQVTTYVNEGVMPGPGSGIEVQPSIPPLLKLGDNLPDNYRVIFAQRQILGVKAPDTLANSGNSKPGTQEYDVALNLGTKYEQGYGPKPAEHPPLLIQKFQKRGDHHQHHDYVPQELPDTGLMATTNIVFATPNISAPLGGRNSKLFKAALEEKQRVLKARRKEKPLDAQVKLLGRLFTKLQRLKPPKIAVPIDHYEHKPLDNDDEEEDAWKKVAKSKVDSPVMAVQIQTFSVPDVDSTDPDIVESMAEFGTHDVEFAETDEIINLMEGVMKHGSGRMKLRDLGSNPQEINENLSNWVRRHLTLTRDVNQEAHAKGEELANGQFKQYQTFVTPSGGGGNGWSSSGPVPVDPKRGSRSMPLAMTHMAASMTPVSRR